MTSEYEDDDESGSLILSIGDDGKAKIVKQEEKANKTIKVQKETHL